MSGARRFFIEGLNYPQTSEVELSGDEFTHAKTVLRVTEGTEIILLDNSGKEYSAIVTSVGKHSLSAHITGVNAGSRESSTPVYLLAGALKGDKTELVVQKATELGVSKIGVFSSRYCSAYMNENKLERLRRVAREAAKQCLRSVAPGVEYFESFPQALASAAEYKNKLFACEFAGETTADIKSLSGPTALVIGSEGGFSEEEFSLGVNGYGFSALSLGKRILRAETAAISALSIVMFCLGELS